MPEDNSIIRIDREIRESGQSHACGSCQALMINGVYCHEIGCPEAWRTRKVPCWECGYDFLPETRPNKYSLCPDCANYLDRNDN